MCESDEEQRRLIEQNEGRLFYFIHQHIHKLNQLLKCSICFEIYENPTTVFNCLHVFCEQCIQTYLQHSDGNNPPCPICRKPILENKLSPNNFLTAVIRFVTNANNHIDTLFDRDVSDLLSFQKTIAKVKEKNKTEANDVLDKSEISKAISSPDFNLLLNARKILIGPDNNVISIVEELPPVQSINFRDGSVKTPVTKKRSLNKKPDPLNVSNKDPFDILKESPIQNPLFKRNIKSASKTYMMQSKNEKHTSKNTKIIPFEDDTNRVNVIKWLKNSQNRFEYKPNTPEKIVTVSGESESQSVFDMPSVSQRHNHKSSPAHVPLISYINKQKAEQNKIREKNEIIAQINRGNSKQDYTNKGRRTRSLEASVKTTKVSPLIKRHSIAVPEDSKENFVIEQFNSEEEALLNGILKQPVKKSDFVDLVENECLNEIEMEFLEKNENNKPQRKRKGKAANKSDTSGWTRIKEFKKTLKRTERKPGKLTLTGVSHTSVVSKNSSKSEGLNKMKKEKGKKRIESKTAEPWVILENIDLSAGVSKVKKDNNKKKSKTVESSVVVVDNNINSSKNDSNAVRVYDLNALELYISNNIGKVTSKGLLSSDSPQITENLQVEDINENKRRTRSNANKKNENINNNELQLNEKPSTSSNNKGDVYLTSRAVKNLNESRKSTPKSRKKLFDDGPKDNSIKKKLVPSLDSERIESSLKQPVETEAIKSNQIEIPKINSNNGSIHSENHCKALKSQRENDHSDSEDELFIKPTQVTIENEITKKPDLIFDDDEDDIFKVPTQVIINPLGNNTTTNKSPNTLLKQKIQTLNDIANIFKIAFDDHNRSNFIAVLKDINRLVFNESSVDVQVQTSNIKELSSFFSQNATTQTASPEQKHKNVAVQTDICPSPGGFRISSTEMFKTQPVVSVHIQTDDLACPKCNCVIKDTTEPVILNNTKKLTQKYILSESFDNINFETQDIIKGRHNVKTTQNSNFKSFNGNNKENLTKQLDSAIPTTSKKLSLNNTNKLQIKKPFKRTRKPSTDSDLEETAMKNIKKSKFIEDDISIQFASELQEEISQSDQKAIDVKESILSGSCESLNYQDCKDNIQKKRDEEQLNNKKRILETPKQPPTKCSKTEDMIRECEIIIQEACSGAIKIENTEGYTINLNKGNTPEPFKLTATALEEFQHNFSGNSSENKIICENKNDSEKSTQSKNKYSESLFASADQLTKNNNSNGSSLQNVKDRIDLPRKINDNKDIILPTLEEDLMEVFHEFNDPFESNTEDTVKENVNKNNEKVKILQNITICKNNIINEGADLNVPQPMEETCIDLNNDKESVKSEDMFLSDSDVVETTPEKNKPKPLEKLNLLSQAYFNPLPVKACPDVVDPSPLSCLNEVFMPPLEFQDPSSEKTQVNATAPNTNTDDNSELDVILVENANDQDDCNLVQQNIKENPPPSSSLTPDILLPPVNYDPPNTKHSIVTSTPYSNRSQIISIRSLNISPIHEENNGEDKDIVVNPIQAAQNSKFSPLTIVPSKAPPPRRLSLITSTPKQKSILKYVRSNDNVNTSNTRTDHYSQLSQKSSRNLPVNRKPCVACTRMNEEQLFAITSLANKKLVTYSSVFSSSVTHMIVDVTRNNHVKDHTMKYVSAVASGIWVVGFGWVQECLKQGRLLPEEPFEALDVSGIAGPKKSRLTRLNKQLLKEYRIHAAVPFLSTTQKEVENVIKLLGGEVVPRPDELLLNDGKIRLIITEAKGSDDFDLYETWLQTLQVVTVDLEWLSRSVGQYETLTLRPFTLCSEDNIGNLGYPEELLVELPFSYTAQDVNTL